ncbi:hypothetical protein [Actinomadura fibrosa]|uniref:Uncharacterized protein n=1 Tax=Actinomadura fibrosa TaxID=111802 RepID=A0ABW2Y2S7_9ACTN|nr:hypothetical protein [Actinomadura fibrosa]
MPVPGVGVLALEVSEDLVGAGALTARLVVATDADAAAIGEVVIGVTGDGPHGWSGLRGLGVLPTGH